MLDSSGTRHTKIDHVWLEGFAATTDRADSGGKYVTVAECRCDDPPTPLIWAASGTMQCRGDIGNGYRRREFPLGHGRESAARWIARQLGGRLPGGVEYDFHTASSSSLVKRNGCAPSDVTRAGRGKPMSSVSTPKAGPYSVRPPPIAGVGASFAFEETFSTSQTRTQSQTTISYVAIIWVPFAAWPAGHPG
jgi:hypothetical protein